MEPQNHTEDKFLFYNHNGCLLSCYIEISSFLTILANLTMIAAIFLFKFLNKYSIENESSNFRPLRVLHIIDLSNDISGHDKKI